MKQSPRRNLMMDPEIIAIVKRRPAGSLVPIMLPPPRWYPEDLIAYIGCPLALLAIVASAFYLPV